MVGYHFTTLKMWNTIKHEGLVPYFLRNQNITDMLHNYGVKLEKGIYVYPKKQKGIGHIGSILNQALNKNYFKVVKLKVNYSKSDLIKLSKEEYKLTHNGVFDSDFHKKQIFYHYNEPIQILINKVHKNKIELIKIYDLNKLIGE